LNLFSANKYMAALHPDWPRVYTHGRGIVEP
jgi:hypothetical protein